MKLLTYAQAAERTGLSEPTIRKLYREGKIKGRTMMVTLFDEKSIEEIRNQQFLCPKKLHPAIPGNIGFTVRANGSVERWCRVCQKEYQKTFAGKQAASKASKKWRSKNGNGKTNKK